MAKRKSEDASEIVKQLRPDDTGWLAELRRAHTDPVDLAAGLDDDPDPPADPPTLKPAHGTPPRESHEQPPASRDALPAVRLAPPPAPPPRALPAAPSRPEWDRPTPPPMPARDRPTPPPGSHPTPPPMPGWNRPTSPSARARPHPPPARTRPHPPSARPPVDGPKPPDVQATPAPVPRRPPARRRPDRRPVPRRWSTILPVLALALGAAVGLAWRGTGPVQPVGSPRGGAPTMPASPQANPPQTILITNLRDDGDSVRLTWVDPTAGRAEFVVNQIVDGQSVRVYRVPRGQNETVITGLDPNAAQYCFSLLGILGIDWIGKSATSCTQLRDPTQPVGQ